MATQAATGGTGFGFSKQAYDHIGPIYQNALVSHHEHAKVVLNRLTSTLLKPGSRVLDVGCGTGRPITAHFADHGHDTLGVDHSAGMLSEALAHVPNAKFLQVDMTSWEPPEPASYDLAIASHCMYNLSIAQIKSVLYKLSRWVKKDGLVVIGTSYNQGTLDSRGAKFDEHGWSEGFHNTFLGFDFYDATFGTETAWVELIKSTGLEIIHVDRAVCLKANNPNPDQQFYFTSRRVQENPLIGPFPIPNEFGGPLKLQRGPWTELTTKLDAQAVREAIFKVLLKEPSCRKVLFFTEATTPPVVPKELDIEIHQTLDLPSPDVQLGTYDGIMLGAVLQSVSSPADYIDCAIQAISPTGPARILVFQAAPDNELVNIFNKALEGFDFPRLHHGYLLREAEKKCRAAGFQKIEYSYIRSPINFGPIEGEEKIGEVAQLLSRVLTDDATIQAKLVERLKGLLKIQFLFKSHGEIASPAVFLVAERS